MGLPNFEFRSYDVLGEARGEGGVSGGEERGVPGMGGEKVKKTNEKKKRKKNYKKQCKMKRLKKQTKKKRKKCF